MMCSFQILQDPLEQLRDAIDKVMPEQLARFHDNRQAHAQVKSIKYAHSRRIGMVDSWGYASVI